MFTSAPTSIYLATRPARAMDAGRHTGLTAILPRTGRAARWIQSMGPLLAQRRPVSMSALRDRCCRKSRRDSNNSQQ